MNNDPCPSHQGEPSDVVDAFIYLLLRDHVLVGDAYSVLEQLEATECGEFIITNKHLLGISRDIRSRLGSIISKSISEHTCFGGK